MVFNDREEHGHQVTVNWSAQKKEREGVFKQEPRLQLADGGFHKKGKNRGRTKKGENRRK